MIDRIFSPKISRLLKQFPAVAIMGPRQCGKTTLARWVAESYKGKALYYDLENPADHARFNDPMYMLTTLDARLIIIDEIQRRPELFAVLRAVIDQKRQNGRFLLLGSAAPEMVKGASESLAGRIAFVDATPFQRVELPEDDKVQLKHWLRGGFPGAYLARSNAASSEWMTSFTRTFVERDLNTLFGTTFHPAVMFRLWRMLAHHHGHQWNAAAFSKGLDVSPVTVNRYVDYLAGAFMLRKLEPWFQNSRKRLVKSPKLYIRDSGILHHLAGVPDMNTLLNHPIVGASWEGYVIEQICAALPASVYPYYYRTQDGAEMDLVLVKGIHPLACIEVKFNSAPSLSRGMTTAITDLKCKKNFIITPGTGDPWPIRRDIQVVNLIYFLQNQLPKLIK
jgi:predicted AAA+ superfamily ATPase